MNFLRWGLVVLLIYMTGLLLFGTSFIFVDYVNLIIHEAGHLLLMMSGPTVSGLGGTFFQILLPIICGLVLIYQQKDWFGGGVCLWWLGENLVNVGHYMADALDQKLPLIGGGHDWAYLFGNWGLINQAELIGQTVGVLGAILMLLAIGWLIFLQLRYSEPNKSAFTD